jgi:glutamate synthase (NADPH/NADH) small chain
MQREKLPKQDPKTRVTNFSEVALGFNKDQAIREATRCLQCKKPQCIKGCRDEIDIPAFIKLIAEGKIDSAIKKIKERNNLPAICGRVCPQETQCELACILNNKGSAIAIGALERFAADNEPIQPAKMKPAKLKARQRKIAVVGSGPSGLTAAGDLAKMGYEVTLFESLHLPGGVLTYGIPEFRLPKRIVLSEVGYIKSLGVKLETNVLIAKTYTIEELFERGFSAVFIGTGAGLPRFMNIPGENLNRVYSANEFLTRINLMKSYKFPEYDTPINLGDKIAVIGGGNVAFDSARVAMRLAGKDKKVTLVYRRTEKEMPARIEEIENAKEEGLEMKLLTQPIEIGSDRKGFVAGLRCIRMQLGEPDASGRKRPIAVDGSEFVLDVDTVIVAIGQNPNPLIPKSNPRLKTNNNGTIWVNDKTYMTSLNGVFAGGDIITGSDTVISAMGAGKKAARQIDEYINKMEKKDAGQKDNC